ncbi:TRAP transporter large permease [Alphaproteobacteria bacterium]|jgi:C4-dicarboxylate transporter DctM subunit|nr:TRAP transporter large permease [Alphaproteobacteria bacterium]
MIFLIIFFSLLLLISGFEMFMVLGIPALLVKEFFFSGIPDTVIIQKMVGGINHSTLLAIPFFIIAAEIMSSGEIAKRLTNFIKSCFGNFIGGLGHTTIGSAMAFGSVSGSAAATVAAIGKLMYPELKKSGFSERFSLGLIVSSAETAILIPPSITMIIYAWMTGTSITALFAGGLGVGIFLGIAFSCLVIFEAKKNKLSSNLSIEKKEILKTFLEAKWAVGMPAIILGGIYSGFFTATEAAAVSVIYAIFVETVIYKNQSWGSFFQIIERGAISSSVIFILLAMGSVISFFITIVQVPEILKDYLITIDAGMITFLLAVNIAFFIAGMFIDPNSALLILVPPLFPVAIALGIDPIHFGIIVTLNIGIGMITPPFGLDIFVASSTLNKPVTTIIRGILPFLLVNIFVLLIITYIPEVSTFLPSLIAK